MAPITPPSSAQLFTDAETAFAGGEETNPVGLAQSGIDLRRVVATIRSNLLLIAAIMLAALGLAVAATLLQTPRYTAQATIQINDTTSRVLGDKQDPEDIVGNSFDTDRFLKTQVDVIKSRGLAVRVAQKLKLIGNARFYKSQGVDAPRTPANTTAVRDSAIGLLQRHLDVDLPRDSRIVTLKFDSTDPELSAAIANAYSTEFIQSNLQRKFDSSSYARGFVAEQLGAAKQRLENSERALNDYARGAGLIHTRDAAGGRDGDRGSGGGESVTTASLIELNRAANDAKAQRITAEARWNAVAHAPLLGSSAVTTNGAVASLFERKAEVEASLREDLARHREDYPSVLDKRSQLAELDRQLTAAANNVRSAIRSDYLAAAEAERRLAGEVTRLKGETLAEQDRTVDYGLLAREADTNREVYDGLLQRYKELNASAGISTSNVSIIDAADPPVSPSSPNLLKNLLLAVIAGGALAALAVFFKGQFDDAVRVPEDLDTKLGMTLLGVIPRADEDQPADALADPKSAISEAYNSLRGSLLYSTPEGLPQVILVTSAQPAEGKTTTSLAIAGSLARMGKRVVLVDADLRRPSLHRTIGYDNEQGLSTLLTSHADTAGMLRAAAQERLSILPSGPVPPSPTELLSTGRLEQVLQDLAAKFDVVVIDSPPILGLADSPQISALADGVVFVVEAARNRRGALKAALRRLRAMRPVMLGAVLTKFDPAKSGGGYSDYYGYDHYRYDDASRSR